MTFFPKADAASVEENDSRGNHHNNGEHDESYEDKNHNETESVDAQADSDTESSSTEGEAPAKKKKPKLGFRDRKVWI